LSAQCARDLRDAAGRFPCLIQISIRDSQPLSRTLLQAVFPSCEFGEVSTDHVSGSVGAREGPRSAVREQRPASNCRRIGHSLPN
jgi:hypothetical protein